MRSAPKQAHRMDQAPSPSCVTLQACLVEEARLLGARDDNAMYSTSHDPLSELHASPAAGRSIILCTLNQRKCLHKRTCPTADPSYSRGKVALHPHSLLHQPAINNAVVQMAMIAFILSRSSLPMDKSTPWRE
jgi:hypothetical protein